MGRLMVDCDEEVWTRQADETEQWYARFLAYRDLGRERTVYQAYHACSWREGLRGIRPGTGWYRAAERWRWEARAASWDKWRNAQKADQPEKVVSTNERLSAPLDRAGMITRLLLQVFQSLEAADLDGMDVQEARNKLPAIRMLFKDLLEMHRVETAGDEDEHAETPAFTADELIAAQRELERWRSDNNNAPSSHSDEKTTT